MSLSAVCCFFHQSTARLPLADRAFLLENSHAAFHCWPQSSTPRLQLGKVVITDAASTALERNGTEGVLLLARHLHGNWGDVTEQDALQNELALLLGLRVLSRYVITDNVVVWIVTEADRETTTIMLADVHLKQVSCPPARAR